MAKQTVLITGSAKRLGAAMALALAKPGRRMILHYKKSLKEAKQLEVKVKALGAEVQLLKYDFEKIVHSEKAVDGFLASLSKVGWPVDVLINNASVYEPTKLGAARAGQWKRMMGINLEFPHFLALKLGLKMKRRKKGVVINLTDIAGEKPFDGYSIYSISKAGLISSTQALAQELAPEVRVNGISPGPILPPVGAKARTLKTIKQKTLLGRFGKPEDIAKAAIFLIENEYVTGEIIRVDGGKSIKG